MTVSPANVTLSSRFLIPDDVLFQELNGEAVILDLASERYFGLDGVGTRFWEILNDDPSMQAAFDQLCEKYEVEPERLERDLLALASDLVEAGLLRLA
jgi:hypothetical protein